jgi:SAM-dependent methyltransferase
MSQVIELVPAGYDVLASEYYDRKRHPTCENFRQASLHLISGYLSAAWSKRAAKVLEVGAGRSVFVDIGHRFPQLAARLTITDSSVAMIRHSAALFGKLCAAVADAEQLPFTPDSFDLVISSLGDPYNTGGFWREVRRVLTPGGIGVFTMPALTWSDQYREKEQLGQRGLAWFETKGGSTIAVESLVKSPSEQIEFLEQHGLLTSEYSTFTRDMFSNDTALSSKIANFTRATTAVVAQFVVRKPV